MPPISISSLRKKDLNQTGWMESSLGKLEFLLIAIVRQVISFMLPSKFLQFTSVMCL